MKVGLIARGEDRGLGILTWEFHRNVQPDRTLLINPGKLGGGFPVHAGRYPGALVVPWDGGELPEHQVRGWLRGLDVLYTAETPYDYRLYDWCREEGVRSVVHAMPEFWPHGRNPTLPRPDVAWLPTPWRHDTIPGARVVPVPVALDRWDRPARGEAVAQGPTFLHVAGHRAAMDRAGTGLLILALRRMRTPCRVVVVSQDPVVPGTSRRLHGPVVETVTGGVGDYWDLYALGDVLVQPRRYGGLSLPLNEAAGAGLALVVPDCEPHEVWPAARVGGNRRGSLRTAGGDLAMFEASAPMLAATMDRLIRDPTEVAALQLDARRWAVEHSWERLLPEYRTLLEQVCDSTPTPA